MSDSINNKTISLWKLIFNVDSPVRDLCMCFLSKYLLNEECIPETLMGRVVKFGFFPARAALFCTKPTLHPKLFFIVNSLISVIFSPNLLSRGSSSHTLLKLLTKAQVIYFMGFLCTILSYHTSMAFSMLLHVHFYMYFLV